MPLITDGSGDTERRRVTFNVGKRILYWAGLAQWKRDYNGTNIPVGLLYEGYDTLTAYAFDDAHLLQANGNPFKENVVYGIKKKPFTDLYTQFWDQSIKEIDNGVLHSILAFGGGKLSFRDIIYLEYNGQGYSMRLQEIGDWDGGVSGLSTPITLIPTSGSLEPGAIGDPELEIRGDCDSSGLVLDVTESGNCYTALIGGSSSAAIVSVTYSYKYETDVIWINGDTLCNPTGTIIFRAVIEFDADCDPVTLTKTIVPCDNRPEVNIEYNPITGCITITVDNTNVHSTIDTTTITYTKDGGAPITYTAPDCDLEGVTEINVTVLQEYAGGCPDQTVTASITFPVEVYDCDLNEPELTHITLADCKVLPQRSGTWISEIVVMDTIMYRYSVNDDWQIWDENTPLDEPVLMRRVVLFEHCPPVIFEYSVT